MGKRVKVSRYGVEGGTATLFTYLRGALSDHNYDGGMVECLGYEVEFLRDAMARLLEIMVERGALKVADLPTIAGTYDYIEEVRS